MVYLFPCLDIIILHQLSTVQVLEVVSLTMVVYLMRSFLRRHRDILECIWRLIQLVDFTVVRLPPLPLKVSCFLHLNHTLSFKLGVLYGMDKFLRWTFS